MRNLVSPFIKLSVLAVSALAMTAAAQAAEHRLDISLDTPQAHVRNVSIMRYADELNKRSQGKLEVRVFHGASKYKGANVPVALAQGALDMGAPLHQHLSSVVPEAGAVLLPMFYGATPTEIYAVWDGAVGKELNKRIEQKLNVKVIGRYFDLGYGTTFTTKKELIKPEDMRGMKIRVPGGAANVQRYKVFGASPVAIPLPDVTQALQRGTVDGIWSTQETVASSKMWDAGLRFAFEDKQAYLQYVPMISLARWNSYPSDVQNLITTTWEDMIDSVRAVASDVQSKARAAGAANGIRTVDPDPKDLSAMRVKLMAEQAGIVKALNIDPAFIAMTEAQLSKARAN